MSEKRQHVVTHKSLWDKIEEKPFEYLIAFLLLIGLAIKGLEAMWHGFLNLFGMG